MRLLSRSKWGERVTKPEPGKKVDTGRLDGAKRMLKEVNDDKQVGQGFPSLMIDFPYVVLAGRCGKGYDVTNAPDVTVAPIATRKKRIYFLFFLKKEGLVAGLVHVQKM